MGFWDFFKKEKRNAAAADVSKDLYVEGEPEIRSKTTGIHQLYAILDRDNEQKGYDDALISPDSAQMEKGIGIIRNELYRSIDQAKLYYDDFLKEIDFHIESRRANAMITTVEELMMRKDIARSHFAKVLEIEQQSRNGSFESMGIVMTYVRGFQKGLAAISATEINKYNH